MSHTRSHLGNMIGKKVHLVLKNGEEYIGYLKHARWRKFGFSIKYGIEQASGGGVCVGYEFDFVKSDIKKISEVQEDGKA